MALICTVCRSTDVIAVHPGTEPAQVTLRHAGVPAPLLDVYVHPGAPLTAWCPACWPNLRTTMGKLMHADEEKGRRRRARDRAASA